ncbi:MAG: hypothetical protein RLZZ387_4951 [Chloroflexota bacterium]|jgi:tetratricopeptide (TPR) repeat protein
MKRTIDPHITTQTELIRLRELLDDTERRIVDMHKTPNGARGVIQSLDQLDQMLAAARQPSVDVRAEEGRIDSLRRRVLRGAAGVVRLVQAAEQTAELKDSPTFQAVQAAQIDESRRRVRRLLFLGVPVLAVMLTIIVLTLLFPPPPQANLNSTRQFAQDGRLDRALAAAQAEATKVPTDPQAALWIGALHAAQGDEAAANTAWDEAKRLLNDDTRFLFDRGTTLLQVGQTDAAEADARALISRTETAAPGYLLLGGVEEMRGRVPEAVAAFEQAADAANKAGNTQLEVIAKSRLGFLMQSGGVAPRVTPTP